MLSQRTRVAHVLIAVIALSSIGNAAAAQSVTTFQTWPEIDLKWKIRDWTLIIPLSASGKRETDAREAHVGMSFDYSANKFYSYRAGYRYIWSLHDGSHSENRALAEVTTRSYPGGDVALVDRNRVDFRFVNGDYSWRYRNRLRVEKPIKRSGGPVPSVTPYIMEELYYDSRVNYIDRLRINLGAETALGTRNTLDAYVALQNDWKSEPLQRIIAIGLTWGVRL
jgi:hypothetical protein